MLIRTPAMAVLCCGTVPQTWLCHASSSCGIIRVRCRVGGGTPSKESDDWHMDAVFVFVQCGRGMSAHPINSGALATFKWHARCVEPLQDDMKPRPSPNSIEGPRLRNTLRMKPASSSAAEPCPKPQSATILRAHCSPPHAATSGGSFCQEPSPILPDNAVVP